MGLVTMKLSDLLNESCLVKPGFENIEVAGIAYDSRRVRQQYLFIAITGNELDGHDFIHAALHRGASIVIGERQKASLKIDQNFPYIRVNNTRKVLSNVVAKFYGNPGKKMQVIGVTGTDGKTTTCGLIEGVLRRSGKKTGKLSTVDAVINNQIYDLGVHVTTPDPISVQKYLSEMAASGTEYAIVESTSHGLSQYRVDDCEFNIGVLTNITHEHFDYHGDYEAYREAKSILFDLVNNTSKTGYQKFAILNADDESYSYLKDRVSVEILSYGIKNTDANFIAKDISYDQDYLKCTVILPNQKMLKIISGLLGVHNLYNSLAAIAVAYSQEVSPEIIKGYFLDPEAPKGRFERIDLGQPYQVFVDYAHTENALKNILAVARNISKNRVILLFGLSGGPRDKTKRPAMGKVAQENSDLTVISAVDWYPSEPVEDILDQIAEGNLSAGGIKGESFWTIPDRKNAINFVIDLAEEGDVVIVAGKGHETSLSINGIERLWSDVLITQKAIERRNENDKK